ncbi:MAG TPA: hypothetical protein VEV84_13855, partial [Pyrinomonadaceae bacterium]|nr:hypothetical protein [Pyrinomonadaceae bacterium]
MRKSVSAILFIAIFTSVLPLTRAQNGSSQKDESASSKPGPEPSAPVVIAQPEVFTSGDGALVKWHTEYEVGNVGFYVYRIDSKGRTRVKNKFVPGSAVKHGKDEVTSDEYSIFDPDGGLGSVYIVESVDLNGNRTETSPVAAQYVTDLAAVSTQSSDVTTQLATTDPPGVVSNTDVVYSTALQNDVTSHAQSPNLTTQRSVAGQVGVKIGVRYNGIYRVTKAQLQSAGFNVNSDSTKWQLYMNGVEQAITVAANAAYVEFYGKGVDTVESDTRMYYLILGSTAGKRISTAA